MNVSTVFICEDDENLNLLLYHNISQWGYDVHTFFDGEKILSEIQNRRPDVVVLDINLPIKNGVTVLEESRKLYPNLPVIIVSGQGKVTTALDVMKLGAYDYLPKPIDLERLELLLRNAAKQSELWAQIEALRSSSYEFPYNEIIAKSEEMRKVFRMISKIHDTDNAVLLYGETGVGKELLARAIHFYGKRKNGPFVVVNCAAIPRELLESEFFGHEKGAFTGAIKKHIGYFEKANGGTLFIDDIDDLPYNMQVKLLRVLQEKEISRVGSTENIPIDVRIICATKVDLKQKVAEKLFREDLYYRLNIIPIFLPPLRERKEDIPELLIHFLKKHNAEEKIQFLNDGVYTTLRQYNWPGNIRELENITERMIALSPNDFINHTVFEPLLNGSHEEIKDIELFERYENFDHYILSKEKEIINWALEKSGHNVTAAAKILKIPRTTLRSKMEKLLITNFSEA